MNSLTSRYPFSPLREGAYFFVTDNSCYYTVDISNSHDKFIDNELLNNHEEVFEISFDRTCDEDSRFDQTICNTILYILGSNIAAKGDTSVYFFVCDTLDGDGKLRARLFDLWFLHIKRAIPLLEKYNFIVKGFGEDEFDISLIIYQNHPNHDEYISEFKKSLNENFSKS